jgi:hypothetical protein
MVLHHAPNKHRDQHPEARHLDSVFLSRMKFDGRDCFHVYLAYKMHIGPFGKCSPGISIFPGPGNNLSKCHVMEVPHRKEWCYSTGGLGEAKISCNPLKSASHISIHSVCINEPKRNLPFSLVHHESLGAQQRY